MEKEGKKALALLGVLVTLLVLVLWGAYWLGATLPSALVSSNS